MNFNPEQLVAYFAEHVERALRMAHAKYGRWVEIEDDRAFCFERILVYNGPVTKGDADSGMIARTSPDNLDRYVQRALNCDLLNHMRYRTNHVREENTVSIQALEGDGNEDSDTNDWWYGLIAERGESAGDGEYSAYCRRRFPLLMMRHAQGLSYEEMAKILSMPIQTIRSRIDQETKDFREWATRKGLVEV